MTKIKLIVAADEPALFFESVEYAESHLEWIDVRDGVYTALYGPKGEIYRIREDGRRVFIEPEAYPPREAELLSLLRHFLSRIGEAPSGGELLPELLERCDRYCIT